MIFRIAAILLLSFIASAQAAAQTKTVRNVTGRCEISRDITLAEAESKALEDAKINAMREAGVPERMWSVSGLITEDDGSEFSKVFSKITTMQVDGMITIKENGVEYSEEMINGIRYAVATIKEAKVKRNGEIDPTFQLDIKGIRGIYANGSDMAFTVKIYGHDAYLRIFWFDETGGSLVYPSEWEKNMPFKKDFEYEFPLNPGIEYSMEKTDRSKRQETINFIAVAVKRDIPFIADSITFETVLKWIYSIPADERAAWREAVVIQ